MNSKIKSIAQTVFLAIRDTANTLAPLPERSIFCYHSLDEGGEATSVTPENFEKHINFLKSKKYTFVTLAEVVAYIRGEITLPKKAAAITFDDGYKSVYQNALPILLKHKVPATVFVVENPTSQRLGNTAPLLSQSDIAEMRETGLITFGNHSKTHRMLDTLSKEELREEIGSGTFFAYPGGHYSQEAITAVKEIGYTAAFSIRPGIIRAGDNPFLIKRNVITADMDLFMLRFHASVAADWYFGISRFIKKFIPN
jgi:peptidoglycan/xylan/chitin deacetylase (PgdA/CDA1 family)